MYSYKLFQLVDEHASQDERCKNLIQLVYMLYLLCSFCCQGETSNDEDTECDEGNKPVSRDEVLNFQINCPNCQMSTETRMKIVGMYL